jgi:hypothetical protein
MRHMGEIQPAERKREHCGEQYGRHHHAGTPSEVVSMWRGAHLKGYLSGLGVEVAYRIRAGAREECGSSQ